MIEKSERKNGPKDSKIMNRPAAAAKQKPEKAKETNELKEESAVVEVASENAETTEGLPKRASKTKPRKAVAVKEPAAMSGKGGATAGSKPAGGSEERKERRKRDADLAFGDLQDLNIDGLTLPDGGLGDRVSFTCQGPAEGGSINVVLYSRAFFVRKVMVDIPAEWNLQELFDLLVEGCSCNIYHALFVRWGPGSLSTCPAGYPGRRRHNSVESKSGWSGGCLLPSQMSGRLGEDPTQD